MSKLSPSGRGCHVAGIILEF